MKYPIILNGDHAEFEAEHANTPPREQPHWPLPSFDAQDWAAAFCKMHPGNDESLMLGWFANALMRGYDEHASRVTAMDNIAENDVGYDDPSQIVEPSAIFRTHWQPIKTAPTNGTRILVWAAPDVVMSSWDATNRCWSDGGNWFVEPTHWMPLPPPPEVET